MLLHAPDAGYRLQVMLCELVDLAGTCRKVALKQPFYDDTPATASIDLQLEEVDIKLLAKEGTMHATMCHPNIVEFVGSIEHEGTLGLLLEYCPLKPRDMLQSCSVGQLLCFMKHALQAMQYMHDAGYVHGDIKLDNFVACMVGETSDRCYKLIDFGLSASIDTRAWHPIGTLTHMATELFNSTYRTPGHMTPAADVFSFGAMVMEVLAGMPLDTVITAKYIAAAHADDSGLMSVFDHINQDDFLVPTERWCKVLWLKHLVELCLHRDPWRRPSVAVLLETVQMEINNLTPDQDVLVVKALPYETAADTQTDALHVEVPVEMPEDVQATTPTVRATLLLH